MEHSVTWTGLLGIPYDWGSVATGLFVMGVLIALGFRARAAAGAEGAIVPDEGLTARNVFELLVESITSKEVAKADLDTGGGIG